MVRTRWMAWFVAVALVGAIAWSFVPRPVTVDVAPAARGPLVVTVAEDARTRVHDRYTVSAPVTGYLSRIDYRPGAAVQAGQVVALLRPAPPGPLDVRTRSQLEARVAAASDALRQARTRVESARASLAQAARELAREQQLEREGVVATQEMEITRTRQQVADAELRAALAGVSVAEHDVQAARAALLAADATPASAKTTAVQAPRSGSILRVFEESERVVLAGTPLLEIGDPSVIEVVADLLSTDAVQVSPGTRVIIDRWGGPGTLNGRVRVVEPSSTTKVSALGVEEQRVNVIIDFTDPPSAWQRLGDGFALEVQVVVWEGTDVVKVPTGALFRSGGDWTVFTVENGRAAARRARLGHQNSLEAEVLDGVTPGERVIVHPSENVRDGSRVDVR